MTARSKTPIIIVALDNLRTFFLFCRDSHRHKTILLDCLRYNLGYYSIPFRYGLYAHRTLVTKYAPQVCYVSH